MPEQKQQIYEFDNFRLDVLNRELLRDGSPVALPAKAFDMLVVLIENGGRLVGKDELFSRVWPDQIVEESNLTVQVSAIRRALGERKENPHYIVTVPGHGYRFIGKLMSLDGEEEEVLIERHTVSRVAVETETAAGADENALINDPAAKSVGHLTTRDEAAASTSLRAAPRRTLVFAGLVMIAISLGVLLGLKRTESPDKSDCNSSDQIHRRAALQATGSQRARRIARDRHGRYSDYQAQPHRATHCPSDQRRAPVHKA